MPDIAAKIIKHNKAIVIIFTLLTIFSAVAMLFVEINYNMSDYIPEESPSTVAIEVMEAEFDSKMPNLQVMITDVSVQEALDYKQRFGEIDGVSDVTWLDDMFDLTIPLEMAELDLIGSYYLEKNALFSMRVLEGEEVQITDEIYELIGERNALAGEAADTAISQSMAFTETMYAAALLIPIIIIILVLSTNSWAEPVFFLTAIGVSILINLGTNIFIGEISFITQSVAPILQLAVSLDYAVFLLHSFQAHREKTSSPEEAMRLAVKESFPTIAASAVTTFFGFMALAFMQFEIGADLGVNLVKGIVFSFISVMVFLPALTILFYKWIDKTQHRQFIPPVKNIGKGILKVRYLSIIAVILVIVPAFLAQQETNFIYGVGDQPEDTRLGRDEVKINDVFGKSTPAVLLVPRGDVAREAALEEALEENDHVSSIISYNQSVSPAIPPEYLDESITDQFLSENYSQIIVFTETDSEGEVAFQVVESILDTASVFYGNEFHALGESVALYDMKSIIQHDNTLVNILTILSIGIVLMFTFRSLAMPVILLLTILTSVWINLAVPYFTDTPLVFVGYLVVGTVQLAATVDYAILFSENYMHNRKVMPARQAIIKTMDDKTFSISISAAILASVGFILWVTSTNPIVSSIGLLLGRGALLAFIMVLFFLPAVLVIVDKLVEKTTLKAKFYREDQ